MGDESMRAFIPRQQVAEVHSAFTYMCVFLVKLLVSFLQDVIRVTDVLFDRHGLYKIRNKG